MKYSWRKIRNEGKEKVGRERKDERRIQGRR